MKKISSEEKKRNSLEKKDENFFGNIRAYSDINNFDMLIFNQNLDKLFSDRYYFSVPVEVNNFIFKLINSLKVKTFYDPFISCSSPLCIGRLNSVEAICSNEDEYRLINHFFPSNKKNIVIGDLLESIEKNIHKYDLICSFLPFSNQKHSVEIDGERINLNDTSFIIYKLLNHISEYGYGLFLVPPYFFKDNKTKELLQSKGLYFEAVFSLPSGYLAPKTGIMTYLVLFSKKEKSNTFVAELSKDESTNEKILKNYVDLKEGKAVQLGKFLRIEDFVSFTNLKSKIEYQEMTKRIKYASVKLISIASNPFKLIRPAMIKEIEHYDNSIYLPEHLSKPVALDLRQIKEGSLVNYYQIVLDDNIANANYVANYLNSPLGRKAMDSASSGDMIPRINRQQAENLELFLPSIDSQMEIINIDNNIEHLVLTLNDMKRSLWKNPDNFKEIYKDLSRLNKSNSIEKWIDQLPFPISSILWRYYATEDNGKKIEHLFHFFEALSELLSVVILSSYFQDKEFYYSEADKWIEKDEKFKDWYMRATFGSWNMLLSKISKVSRGLYGDKDRKYKIEQIFGNPSQEFYSITNKEIIDILKDVCKLRNEWKGHGGITSSEENKHRLVILEKYLNRMRANIVYSFEETRFISPTTNVYEDGVFIYNAKELVGARTPFNEIKINSLIPLDRRKLYLYHANQVKPIELLPFIKYHEVNGACYFYSSIESKNVRWVSYHFEKEPEIKSPDNNDDFVNLFNLLNNEIEK